MILKIANNGKGIKIEAKKLSYLGRFLGLMFKARESGVLLFEFKSDDNRPIHSLFVFHPFLAVWLDKDNKILEHRIVKPFIFKIKAKKPYRKLIEVPINRNNAKILHFFVGKGNI